MDPLSVTASVLAIVGAAQQTVKGIAKLRAFQQAPAELSALLNEVADLQAVLTHIATLGEQLDHQGSRGPVIALQSHIIRAKDQLLLLDQLIHYHLVRHTNAGEIRVARLAWARDQTKVHAMQSDLRSTRLNLSIILGAVTS